MSVTDRPKFGGFPSGAVSATTIPNVFFTELLPCIDSLLELRVTLHAMRLLAARRGYPVYLTTADMLADSALVAGLGSDVVTALAEGLEQAVARGSLLTLEVERARGRESWYFLNSTQGRRMIEDIRNGKIEAGDAIATPEAVTARVDRPNIYSMYEQNIGLLTPMIAEELATAERLYPADWLADAVRHAVSYNRRNWKYVVRILERWAIEGKRDEETGRGAGGAGASQGRGRSRSTRG